MESTKNSHVTKQVDKLLSPLRAKEPTKFKIIQTLLDDVYNDPTINSPESSSRDIENKLYQLIDNHIKFDSKPTLP